MRHLLVTNDFPPKVGGIQNLLWEWWRRLPPGDFAVLTSPHPDSAEFDAAQPFRIERVREPVLLPHPWMASRIDALAKEIGAERVVLDPAVPLGLVGRSLRLPYVVVLHGAEVTVPGRLPVSRAALSSVLRGAAHVVAAGQYAADEARRAARCDLPVTVVPPGVDVQRFVPLDPAARAAARAELGFDRDDELVVGVSRLVPRKGFDTLLAAVAGLDPDVQVAIAGSGRDRERLDRLAAPLGARARLLGKVPDADLPALYGCADVFAMCCRDRWRGLEAEGFGIVFVEAAACGVPAVAGRSGGAHEAVVDGVTGLVVDPHDVAEVRRALDRVLRDDALRARLGAAARERAATELSYDALAARLAPLAAGDLSVLQPLG